MTSNTILLSTIRIQGSKACTVCAEKDPRLRRVAQQGVSTSGCPLAFERSFRGDLSALELPTFGIKGLRRQQRAYKKGRDDDGDYNTETMHGASLKRA